MFDFLKPKKAIVIPENTEYVKVYEEVRYGDRVKINNGFYKDLTGKLVSEQNLFLHTYGIEMDKEGLGILCLQRSSFEKIK